jgi:O-antigen ligase
VISTLGAVFLVLAFGDDERARWRLLAAYTVGTAFLSLSSLGGPVGQGRRIGYSIHPNALGHSCMMGLAAAVWLWDNSETTAQKRFWGGMALVQFVGLTQSGSRGMVLGLGVGALMYLALRGNQRLTLAVGGISWLLGMSLALGLVHLPEGNPLQRIATEGTQDEFGSNASRVVLLERDWGIITESPLWGAGFEDDTLIVTVHVVYLQAWVGAGAIGGVAIILTGLIMLISPLVSRRKDLALAAGAAAVAIAWLFTNILPARDQWMFLAIFFMTIPPLTSARRGARAVHDGAMPVRSPA